LNPKKKEGPSLLFTQEKKENRPSTVSWAGKEGESAVRPVQRAGEGRSPRSIGAQGGEALVLIKGANTASPV